MPTPTGTISLSDVNVELGYSSTATISLNDAAVRALAGVGGAGTLISMDNLRGKSNLAAVLQNYNANTYDISIVRAFSNYGNSVEAFCEIVLQNNGTALYRHGDSVGGTITLASFTWKTGGGVVGDYYAYMYAPSGDAYNNSSSAVGTALQLSTSQVWRLRASAGPFGEENLANNSTIQIRNAAGTALASKTIQMTAFASGY